MFTDKEVLKLTLGLYLPKECRIADCFKFQGNNYLVMEGGNILLVVIVEGEQPTFHVIAKI
jgi:hypothetical protein